MIRKIVLLLITVMIMCFASACGEPSDGDGTGMEYDATTAETVNLSVLPEDITLVPFEKFKEGFAFVSNTNWEEPPATLEEVQAAFGYDGVYYANCDVEEDGTVYKTYAWFSDEDWLDSKVALAVSFKVDEATGDLVYYSYVSQGIDYTEV